MEKFSSPRTSRILSCKNKPRRLDCEKDVCHSTSAGRAMRVRHGLRAKRAAHHAANRRAGGGGGRGVPAHASEWYEKHMYGNPGITQWHTEKFGPPDKFGYKDFIPLFTATNWDP